MSLFLIPSVSLAEDWEEQSSNHFVVYYKDAPADFINNVNESAEQYYSSITNELGFTRYNGWLWENKATIYIYNDAQDYLNATKQPSWSAGLAAYREKKITTYIADAGFFDTILPHELGHIIFREFIGFRSDIPNWLDEGVASCQERARRFGSSKIVRRALAEKRFVPLTELEKVSIYSSKDKDFVELFYAEAASVVYFLLTNFNRRDFVDFCTALKKGKSFNEALHEGYPRFENLDELNRQWLRFLENG